MNIENKTETKTKTKKGTRSQLPLEAELEGDVKERAELLAGIGDKPEHVEDEWPWKTHYKSIRGGTTKQSGHNLCAQLGPIW